MGGIFSYHESGLSAVTVTVKRKTVIGWAEQRLAVTVQWLEHKKKRLAGLLENKELTEATLKSMMRTAHAYGASNSMAGRAESDHQAQLQSLVGRIGQLQHAKESLEHVLVGLKAAEEDELTLTISSVVELQPGTDPDEEG